MKRAFFAVAALSLVCAAAPVRDYRTVTATAPTGGFITGNPAAKIALVEYLSFTCPHCAHFSAESKASLHDGFVRNGSVRVEVRSAVRDAFDMAAWKLARCGGPARFAALSSAIFAAQNDWIARGSSYVQANEAGLKAMTPDRQFLTIALNSGLADIGAKAGITRAQLNQCYANPTMTKTLVTMTDAAFKKINGTPGFEINGQVVANVASWDRLEPALRAAGAK